MMQVETDQNVLQAIHRQAPRRRGTFHHDSVGLAAV
jgi:hypothetical protein